MNQPSGQSTGEEYSASLSVVDTGGIWHPPPNLGSTSGGGGGNPLEPRIIALETDVRSINENVGHIKSDISNIWITIIGGLVGVFTIIFGLYVYTDYKTDGINEKLSTLHVEVIEEFGVVKNDINIMKYQNEKIINDIGNLTTTVNKLVGIKPAVKNDKP